MPFASYGTVQRTFFNTPKVAAKVDGENSSPKGCPKLGDKIKNNAADYWLHALSLNLLGSIFESLLRAL